jgi:CBS domain-containing protein
MSEYDDEEYESPEPAAEALSASVLNDTVAVLSPTEPICLSAATTVSEAVERMLGAHQAGVLIVDEKGRLAGIFTERDVLHRVVGKSRNPRTTPLREVMTAKPQALSTRDRIAYAVHCMSVAGYRTVPLVDDDQRPIGVVTVNDVIRWLAGHFPEAVLNLPPGDTIKQPDEMDMG